MLSFSQNTSTTSCYVHTDGITNNPNRSKVLEGNQTKSFDDEEKSTHAILSNITPTINVKNDTQFNYEKEKSFRYQEIGTHTYNHEGYTSSLINHEKQSIVRKRISDIFQSGSCIQVCISRLKNYGLLEFKFY